MTWLAFRISLLALVLSASTARAGRVEFTALVDEKRIEGAEVCFFRAGDAGSPFSWYFTSDDVRCSSADKVIEIPPGNWNFFLRHERGYVSAAPSLLMITAKQYIPELGFHRVGTPLHRSATLTFAGVRRHLRKGQHFAVYYPRLPEGQGSVAQPLAADSDTVTVPAGIPLIPLVIENGLVARILAPLQAATAGSTIAVPWREGDPNTIDLVYWIRVARLDLSDEVLRGLEDTPKIEAKANGRVLPSLFPPPSGSAMHMSLQFVLDAPAGPAEITMRGNLWETSTVYGEGTLQERTLNLTDPLVATPASLLRVSFATGRALDEGDRRLRVRLLSCPGLIPNDLTKPDTSRCSLQGGAERSSGEIAFPSLPAGVYVIEAFHDPARTARTALYAAPGVETHVRITSDRKSRKARTLPHIEVSAGSR